MNNKLLYLALFSVSFFWGTSFALVKIGLSLSGQVEFVFSRLFVSACIFAIFLCFLRKSINIKIAPAHYKDFFILSIIGITTYYPIQTLGVNLTTTIHSALIMATSPIICSLFILYAEKNFPKKIFSGILLAFSGVGLIILTSSKTSLELPYMFWGDILLLINSIAWAYFSLRGRQIMTHYHPFVCMAYIFILGTILLIPLMLVFNAFQPLVFNFFQPPNFSLLGILVYLGIFSSVYSYFIWYKAINTIGAVKTSVFMYLNPLISTITGALFLSENLTITTIVGGTCILCGVYLVNKNK